MSTTEQKAYLVGYFYYDEWQIFGIFSTPEKAQEYINKQNWSRKGINKSRVYITEYTIDKPWNWSFTE